MSNHDIYARLRAQIDTLPVIDCHEHTIGPQAAPENCEPIACLIPGYVQSDLQAVVYPGWEGARPGMWEWLNDQWLPIIDPVYAKNLLSEGLGAVPHAKFHAFGGDYRDEILHAAAHLSIARDVVAAALAEQVAWRWINEDQALQIAADWLFNNPNEFFGLGCR